MAIINVLRLRRIHVLSDGAQVLCHAGATLHALESLLAPMRRERHSVIGSSCIGTVAAGGICNNSGGALVRRGPAYTELALYAHLNEAGSLTLVNHFGLDLGETPEATLEKLDDPSFNADNARGRRGVRSNLRVRRSRYPGPPHSRDLCGSKAAVRGLASGSAGKVAGMAIRLDSFAAEDSTQTFYVGTNDPADFTALRRNVLAGNTALPIATEYLHGEAFDLAERYGRDMLDPSWTTLYESKSKRATKKFLVGVEPAGSR